VSSTRKLQRTGGKEGSFVVTLPREWVKAMNLQKSAELNVVVENDNRLTIYPGALDATRLADRGPCRIIVPPVIERINQVDDTNRNEYEMFLRKIICSYLIGHTKITLKGRISKNVRERLLDFVRERLFGLELSAVGQDETIFTMYVHTISIDEEFAVIKDATNNVFKDLCELLDSPATKEHLADFVNHANKIIAGHYFYIVRLLKAGADNPTVRRELRLRSGRDLLGARIMIFNIERIGSHARKIVNMLKELQSMIPKGQSFEDFCGRDLVNTLKTGLDIAGQSFRKITEDYPLLEKSDFDSVNQAVSAARNQRDIMIRYRDSPPDEMSKVRDISNLRIIVESVGRICEYTSDVGEVALNLLIKDFLMKQTEDQDKTKKMPPYTLPGKQRGKAL
jgi:phosphate uptake regulator